MRGRCRKAVMRGMSHTLKYCLLSNQSGVRCRRLLLCYIAMILLLNQDQFLPSCNLGGDFTQYIFYKEMICCDWPVSQASRRGTGKSLKRRKECESPDTISLRTNLNA